MYEFWNMWCGKVFPEYYGIAMPWLKYLMGNFCIVEGQRRVWTFNNRRSNFDHFLSTSCMEIACSSTYLALLSGFNKNRTIMRMYCISSYTFKMATIHTIFSTSSFEIKLSRIVWTISGNTAKVWEFVFHLLIFFISMNDHCIWSLLCHHCVPFSFVDCNSLVFLSCILHNYSKSYVTIVFLLLYVDEQHPAHTGTRESISHRMGIQMNCSHSFICYSFILFRITFWVCKKNIQKYEGCEDIVVIMRRALKSGWNRPIHWLCIQRKDHGKWYLKKTSKRKLGKRYYTQHRTTFGNDEFIEFIQLLVYLRFIQQITMGNKPTQRTQIIYIVQYVMLDENEVVDAWVLMEKKEHSRHENTSVRKRMKPRDEWEMANIWSKKI